MDVLVICISTHRSDDIYSPETGDLMDLAFKISKEAKNGALVSIESTIPKGTSKRMFEIMKKLGIEFYGAKGPNQDQFYSIPEDNNEVNFSETEYDHINGSKTLSIPLHPVSEVEIAEITKIVENTYRYVQIAFAEELYLYCKENGVCFAELRDALNTKWNVDILEPREGIGGHCLPKDVKMFLQSSKLAKSKIVTAATDVDAEYRSFKGQENGTPQSSLPIRN